MKKKKKDFFFGKENDIYTKKIILFLKNKFDLIIFLSSTPNEKFDIKIKKTKNIDYIFCFRSYFILKKNILSKVRYHSINFHPGPPEFRGIGCVNFALLNQAKYYGLTAHLIDEKVDHGIIIDVERFKIEKTLTVEDLLDKDFELARISGDAIDKPII